MSGVVIAIAILSQDATVTAVVPKSRIYPGEIPQGASLPCIGVVQISGQEVNTLSGRESQVLRRERIQVSVAASTFTAKHELFLLVRQSLRYQRGQVSSYVVGETTPSATFDGVSILPSSDGPDFKLSNPSIYMQTKDFEITYLESNA